MCENKDRPDVELEALVREALAGLARLGGWVVLKDVERVAVDLIKSAQDRTRQHGEDLQLAIARQNAALAEVAELRDWVEALTAKLEEEERMVKRLREVVLGAPKWWMDTVPVGDRERPRLMTYQPTGSKGYYAVLDRLAPDGLGLAGEVDNKEGADA